MKVLMKSYNLLGDALQTTPVIHKFQMRHPEVSVTIGTRDDYIAQVYERVDQVVKTIKVIRAEEQDIDEDEFDLVLKFNIGQAFQIGMVKNLPASVCYGLLWGLDVKEPLPEYHIPLAKAMHEFVQKDPTRYVIFQPYSVSCSSWSGEPANKRWQDEKWGEIYRNLLDLPDADYQVLVLGGPDDKPLPDLPVENHRLGLPLDEVAMLQSRAALVLTIDNGAAHLAASQRANMLELYPSCLPLEWMSNMANPNGNVIHYRPWELEADFVWEAVQTKLLSHRQDCITEKEPVE